MFMKKNLIKNAGRSGLLVCHHIKVVGDLNMCEADCCLADGHVQTKGLLK